MTAFLIECPSCHGRKDSAAILCGPEGGGRLAHMPCDLCKDLGEVTREKADAFRASAKLRALRIEKNYSTREAAALYKVPFLEWNNLDHARAPLADIEAAYTWLQQQPSWDELHAVPGFKGPKGKQG